MIAPDHEPVATLRERSLRNPLLVGLPLAAVAIAAWDPARNGGPPLCPFRGLTGIACPGCGLTRAAGALFRGRLDEALHLHPLVLVLVVQLAALWLLLVTARSSGLSRSHDLRRRAPGWITPAVLAANALVFVGVWVVRLANGSIDTSA